MKTFIIVIFAVVLNFAQAGIDSIILQIKNLPDSSKINRLVKLCWEKRSIDPSLAIQIGEKAIKMMDKCNSNKYKSEVLNYLGVIYSNLGQLETAYKYYTKGYEIAKETSDKNELAYSLNNLGDYYFKNALYATAYEKVLEAYVIFEEINNEQGMAYTLNDLGEIFIIQKDYKKALEYFNRSAELRLKNKDRRGYAKSLINIAGTYANLNDYDKANETYISALAVSEEVEYIKGKSWIYAGIADLNFKTGKFGIAIENSNKAVEIDVLIGNKYGEIINYNRLGQIYEKMSDIPKAKFYFEKAKMEANNTGHLEQLMVAYKYLYQIFEKERDLKAAYEYLKEYDALNEKIFSLENSNKIADLQTAFAIGKKQIENEHLKKELEYQKNTRNYLVIIVLLALGVVVLYLLKYKSTAKANQLLKELNSSKDKFFSIISHDLKNPVGAVANLAQIIDEDYDKLSEEEKKHLIHLLSEASSEVLKLLFDLLTWVNTQKGCIGIKKTNLNLKSIFNSLCNSYKLSAKNKNLLLEVAVNDDVNIMGDKFIIETIIGNFIDNAIKFSFKGNKIILSGNLNDSSVKLSVIDFGKGISQEMLHKLLDVDSKISTKGTNNEKGTGLGLKICKEFAKLHKGKIEIESEVDKGSTFSFIFPNK